MILSIRRLYFLTSASWLFAWTGLDWLGYPRRIINKYPDYRIVTYPCEVSIKATNNPTTSDSRLTFLFPYPRRWGRARYSFPGFSPLCIFFICCSVSSLQTPFYFCAVRSNAMCFILTLPGNQGGPADRGRYSYAESPFSTLAISTILFEIRIKSKRIYGSCIASRAYSLVRTE